MSDENVMQLDIQEIMSRIPHRYPMLLVDRVLEMIPAKRIVAIKNVTINEPFFTGHFPDMPVMPGVFIIEAMAQCAAIFSFAKPNSSVVEKQEEIYYLVGVDETRFRKPVVPGDQLRFEVDAIRISKVMCKYDAKAYVDDQLVAEAKLMCAVRKVTE
ncbi:(3r)-hydroxymyristoyl-[acyl-carrier-protein] dehydratase [Taylorella asinigenitalis 14/45]|uniref:3-hydroxyacyl-[acyl-carrier-protein] dehydratase FabZ n=3 Tax=Taylorella asinigenitalis TaxID=84590 RepID=G4Q9N1_TAYAM|nr:(3R)-hydroxymyristoyl-[acyl carrier protein] dehydratase [Taylorella asinigenitalis MCE3]CCG18899.1 (3r)-hydroxymyristoyl-[acyl-carrier-protein] dehydratase [Taylorella asinigenitalis 14/45]